MSLISPLRSITKTLAVFTQYVPSWSPEARLGYSRGMGRVGRGDTAPLTTNTAPLTANTAPFTRQIRPLTYKVLQETAGFAHPVVSPNAAARTNGETHHTRGKWNPPTGGVGTAGCGRVRSARLEAEPALDEFCGPGRGVFSGFGAGWAVG